jgi:hypothetical protein
MGKAKIRLISDRQFLANQQNGVEGPCAPDFLVSATPNTQFTPFKPQSFKLPMLKVGEETLK